MCRRNSNEKGEVYKMKEYEGRGRRRRRGQDRKTKQTESIGKVTKFAQSE
jgi:hypothetical protein